MVKNKIAFFYPLKFFLAFCIVLAHLRFSDIYIFGNVSQLTWNGGTQCYMLMAGMLFYLCYYKKVFDGEISSAKCVWHRIKSIYIMFALSVVVGIVLKLVSKGGFDYWNVIKSLFFFGNSYFQDYGEGNFNYPMWFLCPLLLSYIIACVIISLTKKSNNTMYWFLLPVAYGVFAFNYNGNLPNLPILFNARNSFYIAVFFIGIFLMKLLLEKPALSKPYVKILCGVFALVNIVLCFLQLRIENINVGINDHTGIFVIWIPLVIALYGSKVNIIFDNTLFKKLSKYSIVMWIWHVPYITLLEVCHWGFTQEKAYLQLAIFFVICIIIYFIQEKCKKIIDNYRHRYIM